MDIAAGLLLGIAVVGGFEPVGAGLEHASLERGSVRLEVLRLDPGQVGVRVALASELGLVAATAREFALARQALGAINGGFFDTRGRPVGLRIAAGRPSRGSLQPSLAVFSVSTRGQPRIGLARDVGALADIAELVQCRPRLVVAGRVNQLKPQVSRRSAVAIDRHGRVLLAATSAGEIDARELAAWLAAPEERGGLDALEALNLDGGGSTQMWVRLPEGELDLPGLTPVADALLLVPRSR